MLETLVVMIHVIVCIALILIILVQTGKGADIGAAFGGGSNQTVFGSSGAATFLSKVTIGAAVVFMVTSIFLTYFSGKATTAVVDSSIMTDEGSGGPPPPAGPTQPSVPGATKAPDSGDAASGEPAKSQPQAAPTGGEPAAKSESAAPTPPAAGSSDK